MNLVMKPRWAALALVAMIGCGSPAPTPPASTVGQNPTKTEAKPVDKETLAKEKKLDLASVTLSPEEIANCKKYEPPDDWKLILDQKLCPVSSDHLGAMDKPIRVLLKNQAVFLCCKNCEKEAKEKPEVMLTRLGREFGP